MANKTVFEGEWENSQFKKGKCTYPDGSIFDGDWVDGRPEGKGKKTWPDGRAYEGEFFAGKPIGKGTKIDSEGDRTDGYWAGGKFFAGEPPEGVLKH